MNTADPANFQSFNVVRSELVATIEQAARDLEIFVADDRDVKALNACISGIKQIQGILRLLEFHGATILAEELYQIARGIRSQAEASNLDKPLELVSNTFFVLNRYLEYVQQHERQLPVLLIPYINELKRYRKETLLPESYFFVYHLNTKPIMPPSDAIKVDGAEFKALLVRLRHMYQLGLLGVFRNKQVKASLGLIRRSLIRLQRIGQERPLALLWWLSNLAVECLIQKDMELIESRKMLLSRIDRIIRQVQNGGESAYQAAPPQGLVKELIYLILISGHKSQIIDALLDQLEVRQLPPSEDLLVSERRSLSGPSAQTMTSLVRVLGIEINNIKKVLETAAQGARIIDDVEGLVATLHKIAETLSVVGLVGPSSILKQEIERVKQWQSYSEISEESLDKTAKTMLYLESAVVSLQDDSAAAQLGHNATPSEADQNQVIATSELSQAEKIVLQECEAGILLTKRAITAYSESGFDPTHISNIPKTLNAVRGGLQMLKRDQASQVVQKCAEFVEAVLLRNDHPAAIKELLETFADAIISVEYFFDTADSPQRLDESLLQVAEESLAALGYAAAS